VCVCVCAGGRRCVIERLEAGRNGSVELGCLNIVGRLCDSQRALSSRQSDKRCTIQQTVTDAPRHVLETDGPHKNEKNKHMRSVSGLHVQDRAGVGGKRNGSSSTTVARRWIGCGRGCGGPYFDDAVVPNTITISRIVPKLARRTYRKPKGAALLDTPYGSCMCLTASGWDAHSAVGRRTWTSSDDLKILGSSLTRSATNGESIRPSFAIHSA
jgi:hypothetical protein